MSVWTVPGYAESQELGSGASGRVVQAVHRDSGMPVAVKYLSDSLRTRPGFVQEFRAEARLLGGLDSPYVAGLYEYVESPDGAAIVMELVDGVSLRTLLAGQAEALEPEAALVLLKGSLLGLADAHRLGVVHRDYKPENVLVAPDGTSRLVDFGIAVDSGISAGIAGTPSYMAPEQWTGAPASPAADVYAATATFFECLTRRRPYTGENLAELALRHVDAHIPAEQVPAPVQGLVRRGLAKDPAQRPTSAENFVRELETVAGAAYGPGWEERGRGRLAALAALLPLLLPSPRTAPRGTTDIACTVLAPAPAGGGLRSWLPGRAGALVSAALVVLAVLLAYGVQPATGASPGETAQALATTSAGPGAQTTDPSAPSASASASASPSASASASPSESVSGSASAEPSASATSTPPGGTTTPPDGETPPPGGSTQVPPTTDPPSSPAGPVAPAVKDVAVVEFRQTGPVTATATFTVTTDGPGPVSITVSWSTGDTTSALGTPDGASDTFQRSGATSYTVTVDHTFVTRGCYWAVQATTNPASADGGASQQLLTRQCDIR
ncbi:serine/threonine-protein kinase [Streptomyces sp. NPDC006458]|uniref:serine/threonine-protein kinase n=1 Tax=Streptomyces sp. NPDC006458 TaxID=3154302 RepID=UPI0033ABBD4D